MKILKKVDLLELMQELSEEFDSVMVNSESFMDFLYEEGLDGVAEYINDQCEDDDEEDEEESISEPGRRPVGRGRID